MKKKTALVAGKSAAKPVRKAAGKPARRKKPTAVARVRLTLEDRRAQLLALGMVAFSTKPYDVVSVDTIAAEAGISRGLLFHYFPSKRDFYLASLEVMAAQMLTETVPAETGGDLATLLINGLRAYFTFVERHADVFVTLLRASGDAQAQELVDSTRREYVQRIRAFLPPATGHDEALLRTSIHGWERMVEGIALDWLEHRDLQLSDVVQLALRGALTMAPVALLTLPAH